MNADRKIRGTGFKHTLPAVLPFFAPWIVMVVLTAPVITLSMVLGGLVPTVLRSDVWFFLLTRMPLVALGAIGLAVFMATRVAGPLVQLKRAFEDVERGDMDRRLRFRRADTHLRDLETAFDDMMVALNERGGFQRAPEAEEAHSED